MKLPRLDEPQRYRGLYVYDFGEWCAVGYTAEEIAVLLEDEQTRGGKVYKIHRARPDGQMELKGVSPTRFGRESGMFFYRGAFEPAQRDFRALCAAGDETPPPCRASVHLADRGDAAGGSRYVVALIYPAEYEEEIGQWLLAIGFAGGNLAEGGSSHVTNFQEEEHLVLERSQLWAKTSISSRCPEEIRATIRQAVQR